MPRAHVRVSQHVTTPLLHHIVRAAFAAETSRRQPPHDFRLEPRAQRVRPPSMLQVPSLPLQLQPAAPTCLTPLPNLSHPAVRDWSSCAADLKELAIMVDVVAYSYASSLRREMQKQVK